MSHAPREALLVVDLGFGDAGKGTVTDYLVRRRGAHTVVRFNGGAQAGHNVVTPDGRHHTFAQLGAGSFVPGVRTHLARHMVVHPLALLVEARHLAAAGVPDALDRLTASADALAITPAQQSANRLRELARGASAHGTCGVGVGETVADALDDPAAAVRVGDLFDRRALRRKAVALQQRKRAALGGVLRALGDDPRAARERRALEDEAVVDAWIDALVPLRSRAWVVDDAHLATLLDAPGAVVFEGAQGVLLDEWRGFHPHTTWSTCTFANALALLAAHGYDGRVARLGVLRAYATRHGQGPFPTEDAALAAALPEAHNDGASWQGAFRVGLPDAVLARYALAAAGGADGLALTHLDRLPALPRWRLCDAYRARHGALDAALFARAPGDPSRATDVRLGPERDLAHQEALGRALAEVAPEYVPVALDEGDAERSFIRAIERALGVPVWLTSSGPGANEKRVLPAARDFLHDVLATGAASR